MGTDLRDQRRPDSGRVWRFSSCEFDESSRVLRIHGAPAELESKPIELLYQLLLHAGEVVTKDELLESVWPGVSVVEGSLATAISKLRKVLDADNSSIVLTVPRIGYRLGVPVQSRLVTAPASPELGLQPGSPVPGRENWQLVRQMDDSGSSEVWLAQHPKTRETRVFKFAADGLRLKGIKREVTLARFLKESLGDRPDFVRVLEWNFETPPFYLESEYCGQNLAAWAEEQGGLDRIPFDTRLAALIDAADAVAAAHAIGVLHKDLKPANILMSPKPDSGWQVKVADFGSAALIEPDRLRAMGITNLGFTGTLTDSGHLSGTLAYMAPEVLAGHSPTAAADVYSLGVLLYQLSTGDFRRPLSPGWEAAVADPLIREDIADAACGDPARRIPSASTLVERLRNLDRRRIERRELDLAQERAKLAEQRLAAARARRPWAIAALLTLAIGLAVSLTLYQRAARERDRANRQTAIAASINQFLAGDLLGRSDPFQSGKNAETLIDAVKQASPNIDRQFHAVPEIAARLHQAIARALDSRTTYADAAREYEMAANLFRKAEGPLSQDAIVVNLQLASMDARSYQQGGLEAAKKILADQEALLARIPKPREDMPVWLASARAMVALISNDAQEAARQFRKAHDIASTLPDFDETARLTLKQRLGFAYIRLGDGATAERLFRELIAAFIRATGPDSPNVLRVRLNLAQALMVQHKDREAIQETTAIYPQYVARLGEDHELSMQVLATQAECEGALQLWSDTIRDNLKDHQLAVHKQGPLSFFAVATLADAGIAQCRSGNYREGEASTRQAYNDSIQAFGLHAGVTDAIADHVASCLIYTNRLDEASTLLQNIDAKAVAQLTGDADFPAHLALSNAEIAFKRGDYDSARKQLLVAAPAFSRRGAESWEKHTFDTLAASLSKLPARR